MAQLRYLTLATPSDPTQNRRLAYWQWGEGNAETIICVHGLTRNGRDFDFLAQALSSRYRLICVDLPGRGKSDWFTTKADYSYATYISDMTALSAALKLESFHWIGTSLGGILGMMMAALNPARIRRMVLNDVGAIISAKGLKRIFEYVGASSFATTEDAKGYLTNIFAPWGITDSGHLQHLFDTSIARTDNGRYAFTYDPGISQPFREAALKAGEITDVDLTAVWEAVKCPVLILRGEESDILSHETAARMCERSTPTQLVEFPGIGHVPSLFDPAQIALIETWLTQSA